MSLHPVLAEILDTAVRPVSHAATRRDAALSKVPRKVRSVIGMRRAGKSTYLRQLQADWRQQHPSHRVLYVSFDDDRLMRLPLEQLGALLEEYYVRFPQERETQTVHWLFDEIQLVEGWERFVRRIVDTENVFVVVSGSSARLLSREVHTSLRGRSMETIIRPFSFREFLRHRGAEPAGAGPFTGRARSELESHFREFLRRGGFPEIQGIDDDRERVSFLQGYVDTLLFRDVVERYEVTQVTALRWLARHCLRNPARPLSVHGFHRDLRSQGLGVAKDAVYEMLAHLTDAFLVSLVPLATDSDARQRSNPRKVFPADAALIHAFDASGRANTGHALETAVFHELDRRAREIGYAKTKDGHEVDFLARFYDGTQELVQVCADHGTPGVLDREVRALVEAGKEHPRTRKRLLVMSVDQSLSSVPDSITVEAASHWMLRGASEA